MSRDLKPTALRRYKDTFKSDAGIVLPAMERHVMRWLSEKDPDLAPEHMHPSEMSHAHWCGRHDFYRIKGTPVQKTGLANPSFRMNNSWSEGHTIHEKYQRWLQEMGVLFGDFQCLSCGHRFGARSPERCQFCLAEGLVYKELPLARKRIVVGGHADGAVHDLNGWDGLIEIKSIGIQTLRFEAPRLYNQYLDGMTLDEVWWRINRPFPSHLKQGQLYLWLAWPRYEQISFIYESKFNQATKEFVVQYNPKMIAPILETAKEVSQCLRVDMVPDRPVWAEEPTSRICASCEYRSTCWNEELDDADTNTENPPQPIRLQRASPVVRKRTLQHAGVRPA